MTILVNVVRKLFHLLAVNMEAPYTLQLRLQFQFITIKLQYKIKLQLMNMLTWFKHIFFSCI